MPRKLLFIFRLAVWVIEQMVVQPQPPGAQPIDDSTDNCGPREDVKNVNLFQA